MELLIIAWLVVPSIGALWFLNLALLLKKLNEGGYKRHIQNQVVIGAALSFLFVFALMYIFVAVH